MSLYLKGLQNCGPSKLAVKKKADILGSRLLFSRFYVVIAQARVRYPDGADFEGLQLCRPLVYKTAKLRTVKVGSPNKADILGSRLLFSRFCIVIAGLREARVRYTAGVDFEGLQPLEIQRLIVPHLKGLMSGCCLVRRSGAWQCF